MYDIVNSFMMSQIYLQSHKRIGALQIQLSLENLITTSFNSITSSQAQLGHRKLIYDLVSLIYAKAHIYMNQCTCPNSTFFVLCFFPY